MCSHIYSEQLESLLIGFIEETYGKHMAASRDHVAMMEGRSVLYGVSRV